jgi:hypothetical protein
MILTFANSPLHSHALVFLRKVFVFQMPESTKTLSLLCALLFKRIAKNQNLKNLPWLVLLVA